jgi:hypothetical protein
MEGTTVGWRLRTVGWQQWQSQELYIGRPGTKIELVKI